MIKQMIKDYGIEQQWWWAESIKSGDAIIKNVEINGSKITFIISNPCADERGYVDLLDLLAWVYSKRAV